MQWFTSRFKQELDLSPPSYLIERISDLEYVNRLANSSPTEARRVLSTVLEKLSTHHDDDYIEMLNPAFGKMLDSPDMSKKIISKVISLMVVAKEESEMKEQRKWWKK